MILIVATLIAVSLMIFGATEFLPGDAASVMLGQQGTPQNVENLRHRMGLDRPAYVRYLAWIFGWTDDEGAVFRSQDGGETWNRLAVSTVTPISRFTFVSPSLGWAVTERRIYNTKDGGARWTRQLRSEQPLKAIAFADEMNGLAAGKGGSIYRTTVGGYPPPGQGLCDGRTCEEEEDSTWDRVESGTTLELNDITFLKDGRAWIVGDRGLVLRSDDGGATWELVETDVEEALLSVAFADARNGVAVGEGGTILVTNDSGTSWLPGKVEGGTGARLNAVDFADTANVWAVGGGGTALHSADAGLTWTQWAISTPLDGTLHAVAFDGTDGVVAGVEGTVLTTADGGASWTKREVLEVVEGSFPRERFPTKRPLNGLAVRLTESGEIMAWAVSANTVWEWGLLGGNMGDSPRTGNPISEMIWRKLPNSAILAVAAFIVAVPTSVAAGVWVGLRPDTKLDRILSQGSLLAISMPEFVTGILLMLIFASMLGWLPSSSILPLGEGVLDKPEILVLPIVTVTGALFAYILRMARANVIEVMNSPNVRTAVLKGLPMRRVVIRHVLPSAILPTITVVTTSIGWMFGGLIIVETVFAYPGIGSLLLTSIDSRDVRLLQSLAMVIASVYVFSNLIADLTYAALDPRIRYT